MSGNATADVSWAQTRRDTARQRRRPTAGLRGTIAFGSGGEIPSGLLSAIVIETTDSTGEVAQWLDDAWWSVLFQSLAPHPLTIEIAPTPDALTHPVVLHQLEMVRRIVANWRIVGEGYADEIRSADDVEQLATGPYHELRLREGGRSDAITADASGRRLGIDELFARLAERIDSAPFTSPILVRIPTSAP